MKSTWRDTTDTRRRQEQARRAEQVLLPRPTHAGQRTYVQMLLQLRQAGGADALRSFLAHEVEL